MQLFTFALNKTNNVPEIINEFKLLKINTLNSFIHKEK